MHVRLILMSAILAASACAPGVDAPAEPVLYVYRRRATGVS